MWCLWSKYKEKITMETTQKYVNELVYQLKNRNRLFRVSIFIWGVLIYAISFSIFFSPQNIVTGGTTGLSIIIKELTGLETSLFVFICSLVFLVISYIFLGKYDTMKAILGSILLPVFMEFATLYQGVVNLENTSMFLIVFIGGLTMGLGNGLILRSGFTVGGFQIIYQILYNKLGISIGKSTLWINGVLVTIGGLFFGFSTTLYAIIGLYLSSVITDRVMLETSAIKTFFIITEKENEIRQYIIDNLGCSTTQMQARGGYSNKTKTMLMCAVPTRRYCEVKNTIEKIDEDVFFLITDTYEIHGGV